MNERITKCNVNNFIHFLQQFIIKESDYIDITMAYPLAFNITKEFLKVAFTVYNFRFSVGFQTLVQCQYTFMQSSCPQKS